MKNDINMNLSKVIYVSFSNDKQLPYHWHYYLSAYQTFNVCTLRYFDDFIIIYLLARLHFHIIFCFCATLSLLCVCAKVIIISVSMATSCPNNYIPLCKDNSTITLIYGLVDNHSKESMKLGIIEYAYQLHNQ